MTCRGSSPTTSPGPSMRTCTGSAEPPPRTSTTTSSVRLAAALAASSGAAVVAIPRRTQGRNE
jgi:hypothetical protein